MRLTYDDLGWDDDCPCIGCDGKACSECEQAGPCYLVRPGDHRVFDFELTCGELRAYMRRGWLLADEDDLEDHDGEAAGSPRYLVAATMFVHNVVGLCEDGCDCDGPAASIWTPTFSLN